MASYEPTTEEGHCIFCEIIKGNFQTPGIFWEDENYMAFLSIDPNTEGFSCVIPKQHHGSDIMKMSDIELQSFILAAKKGAHILENYFQDVGRIGVIMEGTGVDHAHIKLVPMHNIRDLKEGTWKQYAPTKEFWFDHYEGWICSAGGPIADTKKLAQLAENIKQSIQ